MWVNSKYIREGLLFLLILFNTNFLRAQDDFTFTKSSNVIVEVVFDDTAKYKHAKLKIVDYTVYPDGQDMSVYGTDLIQGRCRFDISISGPVFARLDGVLLNVPAFNMFSKWFYWDGIFLEPGDSLMVSVHKPDASSGFIYPILEFSGKGAEKMHCQQEIILKTRQYPYPRAKKNAGNLNLTDSVIAMIINVLDKYPLSNTSRSVLKATYISMFTPDISELVIGSEEIKKIDIRDAGVKQLVKDRLSKSLEAIDPNDSALVYCRYLSLFQKRAIVSYALEGQVDIPDQFGIEYYKALNENLPRGRLKNRVLTHCINVAIHDAINSGELSQAKDMEAVMQLYLNSEAKGSANYNKISNKYEQLKKGLVKDAPAFPFVLEDVSGKMVKLADFKGKVVVMDFMFNKCIPCRQIVPFLKQIEMRYRDQGLVFLTVCIDKDRTEWMEAIRHDEGFQTISLWTNGKGFLHPIIEHYDISEYPTLVLIDANGKLITPRGPDPRFDNGKAFEDLINAALKSKNL